jgi:PAS domain S-box-containing protein
MSTDTHAWLYQQIVEQAQDAMIFADRDGVIRLWNAGAEAIFGYRADEAVGRTLDLIIPEHLRARHWAGYRQVMGTGVTRYGREVLAVPALRQDGTRLSLEFTIILVRDAAGDLLGPAAIIRDVTARWQRDRALKERLAAPEAQVRGAHELTEDERGEGDTHDRGIPPG